ncbi:MAG: di-trans,poly-cis-decaprenylcistransferase [Alphaproteobacteria bacterium]|nr:di-trans,poly-cis-decaprenylcistransferase [Alphaproteobacteria bacterium]
MPALQHVAIIMDGNGRWAQARGLPRVAGHKQGAEAVERIVRAAKEAGINYLTLFAFSTENWKRPEEEVTGLMALLRQYLRSKTVEMHKNNVRLKIIGDRTRLSADILASIDNAETLTRDNDGITVLIALSYSGRWDITQAMQKIAAQNIAFGDITEELISAHLSTAGIPEPDLIIRTSGEQRVSNFLLWQGAYSEYFFTDVHWPDFDAGILALALQAYSQRDRRFGKLRVQAS